MTSQKETADIAIGVHYTGVRAQEMQDATVAVRLGGIKFNDARVADDLRALGLWMDAPHFIEPDLHRARCVFQQVPKSEILNLLRRAEANDGHVARERLIGYLNCKVREQVFPLDYSDPQKILELQVASTLTTAKAAMAAASNAPQPPTSRTSKAIPTAPASFRQLDKTSIPTAPAALRQLDQISSTDPRRPPAPRPAEATEWRPLTPTSPREPSKAQAADSQPPSASPINKTPINAPKPPALPPPVANGQPPSPSSPVNPPEPLSTPPALPLTSPPLEMAPSASPGAPRSLSLNSMRQAIASRVTPKSSLGQSSISHPPASFESPRAPLTVRSLPENKGTPTGSLSRASSASSNISTPSIKQKQNPTIADSVGEPAAKRQKMVTDTSPSGAQAPGAAKAGAGPSSSISRISGSGDVGVCVKHEEADTSVSSFDNSAHAQQLAALKVHAEQQASRIQMLEQQLAQRAQHNARVEKERAEAQQSIEDARRNFREALAGHQKGRDKLQKQYDARLARLEELEKAVPSERALREAAETERTELAAKLSAVTEAEAAAVRKLQELQDEHEELQKVHQKLKRTFHDLERDFEDAADDARDAEHDVDKERVRVDELREQLKEKRGQTARWAEAYDGERAARKEATIKLEEERRERARLEAVLSEMRAERNAPFVVPAMVDAFVKLVHLSHIDKAPTASDDA